jgi:hypothetical protein
VWLLFGPNCNCKPKNNMETNSLGIIGNSKRTTHTLTLTVTVKLHMARLMVPWLPSSCPPRRRYVCICRSCGFLLQSITSRPLLVSFPRLHRATCQVKLLFECLHEYTRVHTRTPPWTSCCSHGALALT